MTQSTPTSRTFDVVIVGGGLAGLTLAYRLRGLDVLLLESEPICGGRTLSVDMGPYVYNRGAQFVPGPDTNVAHLANELGVRLTLIRKTRIPVHMKGRLITVSSNLGYVMRLPIPFIEKARMGLRLLRIRSRYGRIVDKPPSPTDPLFRELSDVTFAEMLGTRHPDVLAHWDAVSMAASTLSSSEVAAFQPVNTFLHHAADEYYVEDGTGQLTAALHQAVEASVKTGARVTDVVPGPDAVTVDFVRDGAAQSVLARKCVMAVPAPVALGVMRNLPMSKQEALAQCVYGAMSTAAFLVDRPTEEFFGEGVWRIPVVGKSIIGASDPTFTFPAELKRADGRGLIRLYAGNKVSQQLQHMPDDGALEVFERDLYEVFPAVRGHVIDRAVSHWPYAICPWRVGKLDVIDDIRRPHDNIHYCGDYTENSGLESAVLSAKRVAEELAAAGVG